MVWQWGEGKTYSRVPTQAFLGEMSCWDDIPPKRSNDELEPLVHVMKDRKRESTHTVTGKSATTNKQTKSCSLSGGTASTGKWWWLGD